MLARSCRLEIGIAIDDNHDSLFVVIILSGFSIAIIIYAKVILVILILLFLHLFLPFFSVHKISVDGGIFYREKFAH